MSELIIQHPKSLSKTQEDAIEQVNRDFLYIIQRDFTATTYRAYREGMKRFIRWFGTAEVADLKTLLLEYKSDLRSCYDSPNTINAHLTTVRGFAGFIYERGFTDTDLSRHLKNVKKADGHTRRALNKYEVHDLIESINSRTGRNAQRDRLIVLLTLANGLRISEVANINLEDIGVQEEDKIIYLLRKGYTDKSCFTILNPKVYNEVKQFAGDRATGALFESERGENLTPDSIGRVIRNSYRRAGITDAKVTSHSLRHTYSIMCIKQGVDILDLSISLNHKSVSTTMTYLRSHNRFEKSAEKQLNIEF